MIFEKDESYIKILKILLDFQKDEKKVKKLIKYDFLIYHEKKILWN
jgi:hypothetical protein